MRSYKKTEIQPFLTVTKIAVLKYIRYSQNGFDDCHDFWELMYVDRGTAHISVEGESFTVRAGEILLYAPGERHRAEGDWNGIRTGFVGFACDAEKLWQLKGKVFMPDAAARHLLADLFAEGARYMTGFPEDSPYMGQQLRNDAAAYALQIVRNQTELLLLRMYEQLSLPKRAPRKANTENFDAALGNRLAVYVEENLHLNPSMEDGAAELGISISKLKLLCREQFGCGFRTYCSRRRLEFAKEMIRNDEMTFTNIAARLGFSSVHYFSKVFKRETGMTPSQYGKSVAE